MCGVMGFVGKSKNVIRTYELATNLLRETQKRGRDATGFYSINSEGVIDWYKNDVNADKFINYKSWKNRCPSAKVLIGHARMSTHGTEKKDINNHPHISDDQRLAIVHNGIISTFMNIARKCNLDLQSQCDSEVILRLIESESSIISGIKRVFTESQTNYGNFACLAANVETDGQIYYYAFRNRTNPITFIDLREELGQLFFSSTPDIWNAAVIKSGASKAIRSANTCDVPPYEIWQINADTLDIQKIPVKQEASIWTSTDTAISTYRCGTAISSISQITEETAKEVQNISDDIANSLTELHTVLSNFDSTTEELDKEDITSTLEDIRDQIDNIKRRPPTIDRYDDNDDDMYQNVFPERGIYPLGYNDF